MIRRRNRQLQQPHFLQWLRAAKATLLQDLQLWIDHIPSTKVYRYLCSLSIVRPSGIYIYKPLKATWRRCLSRQNKRQPPMFAVQLTVLTTLTHRYILILKFSFFSLFLLPTNKHKAEYYSCRYASSRIHFGLSQGHTPQFGPVLGLENDSASHSLNDL